MMNYIGCKGGKQMTINIFGITIYIKKEIKIIGIIVALIISVVIGYSIVKSNREIIIEPVERSESTIEAIETSVSNDNVILPMDNKANSEEEIKVYVTGCVNKRGIVTLKKGQLIDDAVNAAGGLTDQADINSINLVYKLKDNVMLYIKSKKEILNSDKGEMGAGVSITSDSGKGALIISDSEDKPGGKVNINTASASELETLPSIGASTAQQILDFRKKNGPFRKIEDIMKVPGIKESRFNSMKDFISVD